MSVHTYSINKHPGVFPVRVGETWIHMMDNCVLVVVEAEAKEARGAEQLCG